MKKKSIISAVLIALTLCALTSCGNSKWLTDYEKAKKTAVSQNKYLMVFFSGNDWDSKSTDLKENITDKPEFIKAVGKDYVLVNIDFSQDIYQKVLSYDEETATKKETKEYEKLAEEYGTKSAIAKQYNLSSYPSIFIATADGVIVTQLEYNEGIDTLETMIERVASIKPSADKIKELYENVNSSEGADRVKAIDALYEATKVNYRITLNALVKEVPELDPNNTTGLLGKYEMQICYIDAIELAAIQDMKGASKIFEDAAEKGHMSPEEKQEAYYTGAYVLTSEQDFDFDRILILLEKAYNAYPEGSHAEDIKNTLDGVRQMQQKTLEQAQAAAEAQASADTPANTVQE